MIYSVNSSSLSAQSFNPSLGTQVYIAQMLWNVFESRWYLSLSDVAQNLVIYTAVVSSSDLNTISAITWADNLLTVTTNDIQPYRSGTVQQIRISAASPSALNNVYTAAWLNGNTFIAPLAANFGTLTTAGSYSTVVDLSGGNVIGSALFYYAQGDYFESIP